MILAGVAILVFGSIICAMATRLEGLIVGRVVQGAGACATSVLARSIARDLFEGVALSRALSFIMVAMAAAPGFSPLLGGWLDEAIGWRATFILVGGAAVVAATIYTMRIGETLPRDKRAPALDVDAVFATYGRLFMDRRLVAPAVAVSLAVGSLFCFFAAAPAILIDGQGLTPTELGYFFAVTVFIVFGAGFAAPRLAARWGTNTVACGGSVIAVVGGAVLLGESSDLLQFGVAISLFLFGMGLVNPLGTAMALQPFGAQAGAASAVLGFLQMALATATTAVAALLPWPPHQALGGVLAVCMTASLVALVSGVCENRIRPLRSI